MPTTPEPNEGTPNDKTPTPGPHRPSHGSSRGIGKGIALELGAAGATVYVTGRTLAAGTHPLGGSIQETADLVTATGGTGVAVLCDHAEDQEIKRPFWTKSLALADQITVGLRSA